LKKFHLPTHPFKRGSKTKLAVAIVLRCLRVVATISSMALPPVQVSAAECKRSDFRIAIDVGHTPEAQGTFSARGVPEHTFNLILATNIVDALSRAGYPTLLITVHGIGTSQLIERTSRARAFNASLFLAIHHDDVHSKYKSEWSVDGITRPYSDRFSGHSLFVSAKNIDFRGSLTFAQLLGEQLRLQGLQFTRHHAENLPNEGRQLIDPEVGVYQYDDLIVLKRAASPAVLLEAGVILNRADEVVLASEERQKMIVNSVLGAAAEFCAMRENSTKAR
jgi:N-acetylmuramoyl-L-alanine amidase